MKQESKYKESTQLSIGMLKDIKHLHKFVNYCEHLQEEDDDENTLWLQQIVSLKATRDELLDDAVQTLEVYYKWLQVAQKNELYASCGLIWDCIQIETRHYIQLGKALKYNINKDLQEINEEYKKQYLYVL